MTQLNKQEISTDKNPSEESYTQEERIEILKKISDLVVIKFQEGSNKDQIINYLKEENILEDPAATQMVELVEKKTDRKHKLTKGKPRLEWRRKSWHWILDSDRRYNCYCCLKWASFILRSYWGRNCLYHQRCNWKVIK